MRKIMALLSVLFVVIMIGASAKAANESYARIITGLSFSGTTATCSLKVYAEHTTDLRFFILHKDGLVHNNRN